MIYLKLLVKPLLILMPPLVKIFIQRIWLRLSKPKIIKSIDNYKYTDEHLKFVHILEAINYLKVAGNMGKVLPQTYFEFGCHSGRTFSAAVNASIALNMPQMKCFAFDSFVGLPETSEIDDGIFKQGQFSTSRNQFLKIVKKNTIEAYN